MNSFEESMDRYITGNYGEDSYSEEDDLKIEEDPIYFEPGC